MCFVRNVLHVVQTAASVALIKGSAPSSFQCNSAKTLIAVFTRTNGTERGNLRKSEERLFPQTAERQSHRRRSEAELVTVSSGATVTLGPRA